MCFQCDVLPEMQIQQSEQLFSSYNKEYQGFREIEAHFPFTVKSGFYV